MTGSRSRVAAYDDDYDFEAAPRRRRSSGLIIRAIDAGLRNPVMAAGAFVSGLAIIVIVTNALANQPMRHPSPLFSTRTTAASPPPAPTAPAMIVGANPLQPIADTQPAAPVPAPRQAVAAADPIATAIQPTPVAQPTPVVPLAAAPANMALQLTQRIQQGLKDRGFYTGTVDGIAGPATSDAIRAFEQRLGVAASGDVNDRVLALLKSERGRQATPHPPVAVVQPQVMKPVLMSAPAPVAPRQAVQLMPASVPPEPLTASVEGHLQKVQRALNVAGYGMLRTDGHFDDKTADAIRRFEAEHGLPITGRLSERLYSDLVVRTAQAR